MRNQRNQLGHPSTFFGSPKSEMSLSPQQMSYESERSISIIHDYDQSLRHSFEENTFRKKLGEAVDLIETKNQGAQEEALEILSSLCKQIKTIRIECPVPFELIQNAVINGWKTRNDLNTLHAAKHDTLTFIREFVPILIRIYQILKPPKNKLGLLNLIKANEEFSARLFKEALNSCEISCKYFHGPRNSLHLVKVYYLKSKIYEGLKIHDLQLQQINKCLAQIKKISDCSSKAASHTTFLKDISGQLEVRRQVLLPLLPKERSAHKFRRRLSTVKLRSEEPNEKKSLQPPKPLYNIKFRSKSKTNLTEKKEYLKISSKLPEKALQKPLKLKRRPIKMSTTHVANEMTDQNLENIDAYLTETLTEPQQSKYHDMMVLPPKTSQQRQKVEPVLMKPMVAEEPEEQVVNNNLYEAREFIEVSQHAELSNNSHKNQDIVQDCIQSCQARVLEDYLAKLDDEDCLCMKLVDFASSRENLMKSVHEEPSMSQHSKQQFKKEGNEQHSLQSDSLFSDVIVDPLRPICTTLGIIEQLYAQVRVGQQKSPIVQITVKCSIRERGHFQATIHLASTAVQKDLSSILNCLLLGYVHDVLEEEKLLIVFLQRVEMSKGALGITMTQKQILPPTQAVGQYYTRLLRQFTINEGSSHTALRIQQARRLNASSKPNQEAAKKYRPSRNITNQVKYDKYQSQAVEQVPLVSGEVRLISLKDGQTDKQALASECIMKVNSYFEDNSLVNPMQFSFCMKYLLMSPFRDILASFYDILKVDYLCKIMGKHDAIISMTCFKVKETFKIPTQYYFKFKIQFKGERCKILTFIATYADVWTALCTQASFLPATAKKESYCFARGKMNFHRTSDTPLLTRLNLFEILKIILKRIFVKKKMLYSGVGFDLSHDLFNFSNQFKLEGKSIKEKKFMTAKLKLLNVLCQKSIKIKCEGFICFAVLTIHAVECAFHFDILLYVPSFQRNYSVSLDRTILAYMREEDTEQVFGANNAMKEEEKLELMFGPVSEEQRLVWNRLISLMKFQFVSRKENARMLLKIGRFRAFIKNCSLNEYFQLKHKIIHLEITLDKKQEKTSQVEFNHPGKRRKGVFEVVNALKRQQRGQIFPAQKSVEYLEQTSNIYLSQMGKYALYISLTDVLTLVPETTANIGKINVNFCLSDSIKLLRQEKSQMSYSFGQNNQFKEECFSYAIVLRTLSLIKFRLISKLAEMQQPESLFDLQEPLRSQKELKRILLEIFSSATVRPSSLNAFKKYNDFEGSSLLISKKIISLHRNLISTIFYEEQRKEIILFLSDGQQLKTMRASKSILNVPIASIFLFDREIFLRISGRLLQSYKNWLLLL